MSGIAPKKLGNLLARKFNENTIREITENYQNLPQASLRLKKLLRRNQFSTFLRPPQKMQMKLPSH